jgi:hypothetical protein
MVLRAHAPATQAEAKKEPPMYTPDRQKEKRLTNRIFTRHAEHFHWVAGEIQAQRRRCMGAIYVTFFCVPAEFVTVVKKMARR